MERAKKLLKRFVEEKLGGRIESLATFDMELLRQKDYEDYTSKSSVFEYDTSELVNAIFVVLWHDTFKGSGLELTSDTVGVSSNRSPKEFRGDTMHTSGSIGGPDWLAAMSICKLSKQEMDDLLHPWHVSRIGNMLLLPGRTKKSQSINSYRGGVSGWFDYFDIFLHHLMECIPLTPGENTDKNVVLKNLMLHDTNRLYFQQFKSFEEWIHCMLLDDYLDPKTGAPIKFWPELNFSLYPHYWRFDTTPSEAKGKGDVSRGNKRPATPEESADYRCKVKTFTETASRLIDCRSVRMTEALRKKLDI